MFPRRRKFTVSREKIVEIKQSFCYVGIKTFTLANIKLFADMNLMVQLAFLPKNTEVEILLNKGNKYLVKTPFGLVGWTKVDPTYRTPFNDLTFHG